MNSTLALLVLVGFVSTVTCIGQPGVSLTSNTSFEGTQCPGDVVFSCNGTVLSRLVWSVDGNEVAMFDPDRSPQNLTLSPSLTVELVTVAQDQDNLSVGNFSSTLTADLRALSENMTRNVTCGDFNTMDTATIPPFIVQSPVPQPVYTCDVTPGADATVALNLTWDVLFTLNNTVEQYCVRASGGACPPKRCLPPNTPYTCEGLTADQEHSFAVTGFNCGSQEGPADNFTITPRVPAAPAVCSSVPVYLYPSGELSRVESNWEAAAGLPQLKPGISQNVTSYSVTSTGRDEVSVMADEACTATGQCTYTAEDFGSSPSPYSLAVSSENLVGTSEAQPCSPRQISSENNIVVVSLTTGADNTRTVHCEFRQSITTSTACNVCYGTQSPCNITNCDGSQAETGRVTNVTIPAGNTCFVINATIDGNMIIIEGSTEPNGGLLPWHVALIILGTLCWVAGTVLAITLVVIVLYRRKRLHGSKHTPLTIVILAISVVLLSLSFSLWLAYGTVATATSEYDANLRDSLCITAFVFSVLPFLSCIYVVWNLKKILRARLPVGVKMVTKPDVHFDDIAGLNTAKEALKSLTQPVTLQGERKQAILLYGLPGTGKASLVNGFATDARSTLFLVFCSTIVAKWGAETKQNIETVFKVARRNKPAVIFLRNVESLCDNVHPEYQETQSVIKEVFSSGGVDLQSAGIVILGATDYPWYLDEWVKDLFDKMIEIPPPESEARKKAIRSHLCTRHNHNLSDDDFTRLVEETDGFTGDDIRNLVSKAVTAANVKLTAHSNKQPVTYQDFKEALPQIGNGVGAKRYKEFSEQQGEKCTKL